MESAPDYNAGLFEHVAKLSHIQDTQPPTQNTDVPPPVRYLNTVESGIEPESNLLFGGKPLVSTLIPGLCQNRSILDLPVQKSIPVKLCKVHPLSNQPDSSSDVEPSPDADKVDVNTVAEQERQLNKELQREKEVKVGASPGDKNDDKKNNNDKKESGDGGGSGGDDDGGGGDDNEKKHHKHKHKKHKKREHSKNREHKHDSDKEDEEDRKGGEGQDHGKEERKQKDQDKAKERRERKKQKKEEKRKARQKKQEQGESSKKNPEAAEPILESEVDKQYSSPSAKIMQDARHQRWKKPTWQPPDPQVEERKVGRNMRAAPLHRTPSEAESGSLMSRRSSVKEQELLNQLRQQQQLLAQQQQLQQLAQDLINEAYVRQNTSVEQRRVHDSQTVARLLNDAFSLARSRRADVASRTHQSVPTSPVPPPSHSDLGSVTSACTEPGFVPRRGRPLVRPLRHRQSSLELLYSRGDLTQLPISGDDGSLAMRTTKVARTVWGSSTGSLNSVCEQGGQNRTEPVGPLSASQLAALNDDEREALVAALQEELCRLSALS